MKKLAGKFLYELARLYMKKYNGSSQNMAKNGEEYLLKVLSEGSVETIFDVGANIGGWTRLARRYFPKASIHVFELSGNTFQNLSESLSDENVHLNNFGLANENRQIEYKDYGENSGFNSIVEGLDFHDAKVAFSVKAGSVESGDVYAEKHAIERIDVLKIDVEGAENLVLDGLSELLESGRIDVIQFEYGYANGDAYFLMKDFYRMLGSFGYVVGPLRPRGVQFCDFNYKLNDFNSGPNFVAVHKNRADIISRLSTQ